MGGGNSREEASVRYQVVEAIPTSSRPTPPLGPGGGKVFAEF